MSAESGQALARRFEQIHHDLAERRQLIAELRDALSNAGEPAVPPGATNQSGDHPDVQLLRRSGLFDEAYYLAENPDVGAAGRDPVVHFVERGHLEGRNPSRFFDTAFYRGRYLHGDLAQNPLIHYIKVGRSAGAAPSPTVDKQDAAEGSGELAAQIRHWTSPGDDFEEFDPEIARNAVRQVKAMAFYLPQFHPIPENDEWWGRGFTEWRNVGRGTPRYVGHYQPRIPRDLGHYDLRDVEVMRRQADLARAAGLHGFCFYYYWFNGKRVLERPVNQFLAERSIDLPFCVMWANENWTRTWDGFESDVLMRQEYARQDDEALVDDLQRHFADPRYLRIDGRPLFLIYRLDIIPRAKAAIKRWRRIWRERHGEDPLIFVAECFENAEPGAYGVDGAIEFPPHRIAAGWGSIREKFTALDPEFSAWMIDYRELATAAMQRPMPAYPLIKTALPGWDNDARRQGAGAVIHGADPSHYERWMRGIAAIARQNPVYGDSLVFVNAWNEWAEAAYLEPDVHYGSAYLNATARAVCGAQAVTARRVLLVGHDAHPHGSQMLLRALGETMVRQFGCEVAFLLRTGGRLAKAYEPLGEVVITDDDPGRLEAVLGDLRGRGFSAAIANTTVTGELVPVLKRHGLKVISLIHELPGITASYGLERARSLIAEHADKVVFAAEPVATPFRTATGLPEERTVIRPQGSYTRVSPDPGAATRLRERLGLGADSRIVLNVGYADLRKGIDIFIRVAREAAQADDSVHFVWLGGLSPEAQRFAEELRDDELLGSRIHFAPFAVDGVGDFYAGADLLFLSSREDPFPTVVLEAFDAGLPVVGFRRASGTEELIALHGALADMDDVSGTANTILRQLREPAGREAREARRTLIDREFRFDEYAADLHRLLDPSLMRVSVVVPNFNYAAYLSTRLQSLFSQTYPVFEILVLDDASSDDSVEVAKRVASDAGRSIRVVGATTNSGSPFRQWSRACELARGELVWIAEADDLSDPTFLERLIPRFANPDVAYAFSDSAAIDAAGEPLMETYKDYYRQSVGSLMDSSFEMDGEEFVRRCLSERNLILNASAVVWRRDVLATTLATSLDQLVDYKLAGDWHLYAIAGMTAGRVAYESTPLNVHRRHDASVTSTLDKQRHLAEIQRVHDLITAHTDVDESARGRMSAYRGEVAQQFGLQ